jgi:hypothetical protein
MNKNIISKNLFVEIDDSDEEAYNNSYDDEILNDEINTNTNLTNDNDTEEKTMYLIHNKHISSDNPHISDFLQFCIDNGLFDNTFYDTHNALSVVATKLPRTFEKLSKDGEDINKKTFIRKFKQEFGYSGDLNFIYNCIDPKKKGFVTWDDFVDFFLPYVQYVTV